MDFRHEWKHPVNGSDLRELRGRLRRGLRPDPHAGPGGRYKIRSLYFDDPGDTALREKLDGVDRRTKFRVRYYNVDENTSFAAGTGIICQNANTGPTAKNHCGIYAGTLHLRPRRCTGHAGL